MDLTLMQAAVTQQPTLKNVVSKIIVERSPILEFLPITTIQGAAYRYWRETSLGTIGYRGVNQTWTRSSGVINPENENLCIMGGELIADNFEIATMGGIMAIKPMKYEMKARAMGLFFNQEFLEGDRTVSPKGLDGCRRRIAGNQLIDMGAGGGVGGTLTLAAVDQLIDTVRGGPDALFMNKVLRRKITALVRATSGSGRIDFEQDQFGRQQMMYSGIPIRIMEQENDASTILDFDEDRGDATMTAASIYAIKFGSEDTHGIAHSAMPAVQDFGEIQASPGHLGRIEWYVGMAVEHPRSMARLYHILNA